MRILVTGANGFLAINTIAELLIQGYKVIGLIRNSRNPVLPAHINLELIEGDLLDSKSLEHIVQKCSSIIHIAAETRQSLINYNDYYNSNVAGTENLIEAALKYKLKKIVYVSTANTIGYGTKENPGVETDKIREPFSKSLYAKSKLRSQEILLSKANEIDVVIVNPTFILGPYDHKPGSGRIVLMNYGKKIIFYPPGGKNFVHVYDVARGLISALKNGKNGEAYLLANENLTYKEFFQKLSAEPGSKALLIKIPKYLLMLIGVTGNILKYAGIRNDLILNNMKILCVNNFYSGQKAQNELNISFQPIDIALKEAIDWFKKNNMIR